MCNYSIKVTLLEMFLNRNEERLNIVLFEEQHFVRMEISIGRVEHSLFRVMKYTALHV